METFDPLFKTGLPLPLARLYVRAFHAKGERERHDHAFHLLESGLKLAAAALVARYRACDRRSDRIDVALRNLALPALGHWRNIFKETLLFLADGEPEDPWARRILGSLRAERDDRLTLDIYAAMAKAASFAGRASTRLNLLDLLDLLPAYRNAMSDAHGSIKADPAVYSETSPSLLDLAHAVLKDGAILGCGRLVYAEDVRVGAEGEHRVVWMDLSDSNAIRRLGAEGERTPEAILPGRVYLELAPEEHLPLHPLLFYQPGELVDRVFFLNRARTGKGGIQFLCYATGDFYLPGRDPQGDHLVADLHELLSWVTQRQVDSEALEALAAQSRSDAEAEGEGTPAEAEPAGRVFGDFEVLGELGRGGMAVVYLARQLSLDRIVALKVLPPILRDDPVALGRFKQEVRALSICDHPHVVKIVTSGQAEDTYYYAMEFIDGSDLGAICATLEQYRSSTADALREEHFDRAASSATPTGRRDVTRDLPRAPPAKPERIQSFAGGRNIAFRLATVIRDAARGAQHIHEHGIIHRDLKPQNILVTRDEHRPVVMDLGLAKVTGASQSLTLEKGSILGTLRYMPPEQLQRSLLEVDARADVYALGAVLYELCCLRPMMDGDSEERLTTQILFQEPPPPHKVNPKLPADLSRIITKATQKDPSERYTSAAELADDLDRFVHGEAISARPPTLGYLLKLFVRRHRAAVTALTLGAVLVAALVAGWIVSLRSSLEEQRRARSAEHEALGVAQRALSQYERALQKSNENLARANRNLAQLFLEKTDRALEVGAYQRAAVFAAAAIEKQDTPLARGKLYQARAGAPVVLRWTSPSSSAKVEAVALSTDATLLASGSEEGTVHLWSATTGKELARLGGHTQPVRALSFRRDGLLLASGAEDNAIRLWSVADAANAKETARLEGHTASVTSVAFRHDGALLASSSLDGTVRLWDAERGRAIAALEGHGGPVRSVAYGPGGVTLATGSDDRTIRLWQVETRQMSGHIECPSRVFGVAFSPDGGLLAAACEDATVRLWNPVTRRPVKTLEGHAMRLTSVVFTPDGEHLASASYDATIRIWDVPSGQTSAVLGGHRAAVYSLAMASSPKGPILASGSFDRSLRLWDLRSGETVAHSAGHTYGVECVDFSPDGRVVASGSTDRTIRLWDAETGTEVACLEGHRGAVRALAFAPHGATLASASGDNTVRLWNVDEHREIARLNGHTNRVRCVTFGPEGKLVASGSSDLTVRIWDGSTGEALATLEGHSGIVRAVAFNSGGTLASASEDRTIRLWGVETRTEIASLAGHTDAVVTVAFSPDGELLASGSADRTIRTWRIASGVEESVMEGHDAGVTSVAFGADGRSLLSASADGTIRLWDLLASRETARLEGQAESVLSAVFSPDGKRLASGSSDGTVRLWSVLKEPELAPLEGHSEPVYCVAISPNGELLASGSWDSTVRLWNVETRAAVGRPLEGHTAGVSRVFFRNNGREVVSCGESGRGRDGSIRYDSSIRFWDVGTRRELRLFPGEHEAAALSPSGVRLATVGIARSNHPVYLWDLADPLAGSAPLCKWKPLTTTWALAFSPDEKLLAAGSDDDTVRIWRADQYSREAWMRLEGHSRSVRCLAFSPDRRWLASGSADTTIRLWDLDAEGRSVTLEGHSKRVQAVAFSPDGGRLASGSYDGTIRIWDVASLRERVRLTCGGGAVYGLAFQRQGRLLASAHEDHTVRLWNMNLLLDAGAATLERVQEESGLVLSGATTTPRPRNRLRLVRP